MKASLFIALILSTVLLSGCGGSSTDYDNVEIYSLDDYRARNINSDSLTGTWVSVSTGQKILDGYSPNTQYTEISYSNKQYFVITETDEGYSKASCDGVDESILQSADEISFSGMTGTNIDNQKFIFSESHEIVSNDVIYSEFQEFEMIKISDSVEKFGVVNLTGIPYSDVSLSVDCFYQVNEANLEGPDEAYSNEEYFAGMQDYPVSVSLRKYSGSITRTLIYPHDYQFLNDFYPGYFNVDVESNFSHEITFSTVDDNYFLYQGDINIQLPLE